MAHLDFRFLPNFQVRGLGEQTQHLVGGRKLAQSRFSMRVGTRILVSLRASGCNVRHGCLFEIMTPFQTKRISQR